MNVQKDPSVSVLLTGDVDYSTHHHDQDKRCGNPVVVKINSHDTLSYSCQECDGNDYCKKGDTRYAWWLKRIAKVTSDEPEKEPKKKDAAPPPQPTPNKKSIFDI